MWCDVVWCGVTCFTCPKTNFHSITCFQLNKKYLLLVITVLHNTTTKSKQLTTDTNNKLLAFNTCTWLQYHSLTTRSSFLSTFVLSIQGYLMLTPSSYTLIKYHDTNNEWGYDLLWLATDTTRLLPATMIISTQSNAQHKLFDHLHNNLIS